MQPQHVGGESGHAAIETGSSKTEDLSSNNNSASPMSVSDEAIVEHSDPRPLSASTEEREERRRVWYLFAIPPC